MNEFWNKVIDGIDDKHIDEAVRLHTENAPEAKELIPVIIEPPAPESKKKRIVFTTLKIAAAMAVVIGAGVFLKLNDISIGELWAARPSETSEAEPTPMTSVPVITSVSTISSVTTAPYSEITTTSATPEISSESSTSSAETSTESTSETSSATAPPETESITTTTAAAPAEPEKYRIIHPDSSFLESYDMENNPPQLLFARDTFCIFSLAGGKLYIYDTNMAQPEADFDITGTLESYGFSYDENSMTVDIYVGGNGFVLPVISLRRTDVNAVDRYYINNARDMVSHLRPLTDDVLEGKTLYDGLTSVNEEYFPNCIGNVIARYDDIGYTYLKVGDDEKRHGIYRTEVIWCDHQGFIYSDYPFDDPNYEYEAETEAVISVEDEDVVIPVEDEDDMNPGTKVEPLFNYNGKDYSIAYNYDIFFKMDDDWNIIGGKIDDSDYYLTKDGELVEYLTNINQLKEIHPTLYEELPFEAKFYEYGACIIEAPKFREVVLSVDVAEDGTLVRNMAWYCDFHALTCTYGDTRERYDIDTETGWMESFNIDFLTDYQNKSFANAFSLMSGFNLNQDLPADESRMVNGYYLTDIPYNDYFFYFRNNFANETVAKEMANVFNIININGHIAWKPYEINDAYTEWEKLDFELIEKTESLIRFKAIVTYIIDGEEVIKEFECEIAALDSHRWEVSRFELWEK